MINHRRRLIGDVRRLSMEELLKRYIAIVLLLLYPLVERSAYAEPPVENARDILDRTYDVYANCRTYRDSGLVTNETHDVNGTRTNKKAAVPGERKSAAFGERRFASVS